MLCREAMVEGFGVENDAKKIARNKFVGGVISKLPHKIVSELIG